MGATENAGFNAKVQRNLGLDFVTKQHRSLQKLQPVYRFFLVTCYLMLTSLYFRYLGDPSLFKSALSIRPTHNLTHRMPYSSMLLHVNLDSLAARREDLSRRFFSVILWILPPVFTASFLHPDPPLSPVGSGLLISFLKSILVPSAIVLFCTIWS